MTGNSTLGQAISQAINDFTAVIKGDASHENVSKNTATTYRSALRKLESHPLSNTPLKALDADAVQELIHIGQSNNQQSNIRKALSHLFATHELDIPKAKTVIPPVPANITLAQASDNMMTWLERIINGQSNDLAVSSARAYRNQLQKFIKSEAFEAYKDMPAKDFPREALIDFLAHHAWGAANHNQAIEALKHIGRINDGAIPSIEDAAHKDENDTILDGQYLSVKELETLLDYKASNEKELRENALITIIATTLATITEIQALQIRDVTSNELILKYRGMTQGHLHIPRKYFKHITRWANWAKKDDRVNENTPLFFNPEKPSKPLSRFSLWKIVKSALGRTGYRKASIESGTGASIHCLRVSAARRLYTQGHNLQVLQDMAQVKSFEDFARITPELEQQRNDILQEFELYKARKNTI